MSPAVPGAPAGLAVPSGPADPWRPLSAPLRPFRAPSAPPQPPSAPPQRPLSPPRGAGRDFQRGSAHVTVPSSRRDRSAGRDPFCLRRLTDTARSVAPQCLGMHEPGTEPGRILGRL